MLQLRHPEHLDPAAVARNDFPPLIGRLDRVRELVFLAADQVVDVAAAVAEAEVAGLAVPTHALAHPSSDHTPSHLPTATRKN